MTTLPFVCETARSRRIAVSGVQLHGLEWGHHGHPSLLFLHGGAAHAHWFDGVTGPFVDRFHVVALDQRGHGQSDWVSPPAYATENFAADLAAVVDALGWRHTVVIGHSMGGHNALAFAAWYPEWVRGLVVVDSRPMIPAERLDRMHERGRRPPRRHRTVDEAVERFRLLPPDTLAEPTLLRHLAREGMVHRDGGWGVRFDPAAYAERRPVDAWKLLERITAPALIVHGERSPVLPREMAERLRDGLRQATCVEIPGAYHHLVLDRPDAFVVALRDFLETLPD